MSALESVKRLAVAMPARTVRVMTAEGKVYDVPALPETPAGPSELEVQLKAATESLATIAVRFEQVLGAVVQLSEQLSEQVATTARRAEEARAESAASTERIIEALAAPVEPVYGKNGKLIGARRVRLLRENRDG